MEVQDLQLPLRMKKSVSCITHLSLQDQLLPCEKPEPVLQPCSVFFRQGHVTIRQYTSPLRCHTGRTERELHEQCQSLSPEKWGLGVSVKDSESVSAALTKYHGWGSFYFSQYWRLGQPRSGCQHGQALKKGLFLLSRQLPSYCILTQCRERLHPQLRIHLLDLIIT